MRPTGYCLSEVAHSWQVFIAAGYTVELASVSGGTPPVDGVDLSDQVQRAFTEDAEMTAKIADTAAFGDVTPVDYDSILFAGGHGTMWDFPANEALARVAREIYEGGGVVAAVCHGPAALVGVTLSNGRLLIEGRQVSAFTNEEEAAVGLTDVVPFLLQTRLEQLGATHIGAANFQPHVVTDHRLVTGQNPASARAVAQAVLAELARPEGARPAG